MTLLGRIVKAHILNTTPAWKREPKLFCWLALFAALISILLWVVL